MYFQNHSSVITLSKIFQPRHFGQKSLRVLIMTPNDSLFVIFRIVPYKLNVKKLSEGWKLIVNLRNINFLGEYWLKLVSASRLFINQENKKHESINVKKQFQNIYLCSRYSFNLFRFISYNSWHLKPNCFSLN